MRFVLRLLAFLMALAVVFVGAVFAASEFGGEVVDVETVDASGAKHHTHLWVVDDGGFAWLRAGMPSSGWLVRIDANPDVHVTRGGVDHHMKAVPVRDQPAVRDRIHQLMREKYPFADKIVSAMPGRDPNASVPVRLEPVQP
jgi:hypothetical protein